MARVVVLGGGIAGHTAALHLTRMLKRSDEIVVVTPNSNWNWIPSNIWVGVGKMKADQVTFKLGPDLQAQGDRAPPGAGDAPSTPRAGRDGHGPTSSVTYTDTARAGEHGELDYDYLVNATGPKLNFGATPGLGPDGHSYSVCTSGHAVAASAALQGSIAEDEEGERQVLVVGMGHGTCTCEGAAFEYAFNVEHEVRHAGVRDQADIVYLTNEYELGDFGVGGLTFTQQGFQTTSKLWTESLFRERGIQAITGAHVTGVEEGVVHYEQLDGPANSLSFDFAMLLPPFRGVDLQAFDADAADISDELFAPNGFMKVDADYSAKPFEEWRAEDWPSTYQVPRFPEHLRRGHRLRPAPPDLATEDVAERDGHRPVTPADGHAVRDHGQAGRHEYRRHDQQGDAAQIRSASMADMGGGLRGLGRVRTAPGSAASMTMYPVVPDLVKYPDTGRSLKDTFGEIGLAGHWIKLLLHYMFIYKAKARPGWHLIPE